jgi:CHASE2 domain-containing sensor protein
MNGLAEIRARDILLVLIVGALLSLALVGDLFHSLRLGSTDFLHGDIKPRDDIVIIAIDDASIAEYGSWPWAHSYHTQLIKKLGLAGAVGIDILFDEVGDPALTDALRSADNVVLASVGIFAEKADAGAIPAQVMLTSPPTLQSAASGEGIVNAIPDSDGVIRKTPLLIKKDGETKEALSLQLLRRYSDLEETPVSKENNELRIGSLRIPVDQWERVTIRFIGAPNSFQTVSYKDVLNGIVSPQFFQGKIVLVGQMNFTGGSDLHDVPTTHGIARMSGVEIQANILQTILDGNFLREQTLLGTISLIFLMSFLGGIILFRLRFRQGIPALFLVEGGYILYAFVLFDRGTLPDLFYPSLSLGLSYVAAISVDNIHLFKNLKRKHQDLLQTYNTTLEGWARALELRDYETKGHTERVTTMAVELAQFMGLQQEEIIHIRRGAILHDIGKIGIPDKILLKKGKLNDAEWEIMRQHPLYGYKMLLPIPFLKPALDIVIYHHEKWDGSGYPNALSKEEIPLAARIFSIVDVWDALTSKRPYHDPMPADKVLALIRSESGTHFDPNVVAAFSEYIRNKQ